MNQAYGSALDDYADTGLGKNYKVNQAYGSPPDDLADTGLVEAPKKVNQAYRSAPDDYADTGLINPINQAYNSAPDGMAGTGLVKPEPVSSTEEDSNASMNTGLGMSIKQNQEDGDNQNGNSGSTAASKEVGNAKIDSGTINAFDELSELFVNDGVKDNDNTVFPDSKYYYDFRLTGNENKVREFIHFIKAHGLDEKFDSWYIPEEVKSLLPEDIRDEYFWLQNGVIDIFRSIIPIVDRRDFESEADYYYAVIEQQTLYNSASFRWLLGLEDSVYGDLFLEMNHLTKKELFNMHTVISQDLKYDYEALVSVPETISVPSGPPELGAVKIDGEKTAIIVPSWEHLDGLNENTIDSHQSQIIRFNAGRFFLEGIDGDEDGPGILNFFQIVESVMDDFDIAMVSVDTVEVDGENKVVIRYYDSSYKGCVPGQPSLHSSGAYIDLNDAHSTYTEFGYIYRRRKDVDNPAALSGRSCLY